jgi:putative toxin-antitoxin system antitoxin component (TIGR02293 family)
MTDRMLAFRSGEGIGDGLGAVRAVREGLPVEFVEKIIEAGQLTIEEVVALNIPENRQAAGVNRLTPEQSDRLFRVLRVLQEAEETFANPEKARLWMRRPTRALGGQSPIELLDTDVGARSVEALLARIAHGIAA